MTKSIHYQQLGLFFVLWCILSSCEPRHSDDATSQINLERVRMELITAMNSSDVDGIMNTLSPDHVTMPPNEPAYHDAEKLRRWHEYRIEHFDTDYEFEIIETQQSAKYAIDYWILKLNSKSISEQESTFGDNKGIWVWEKQDDNEWKLLWSIWNENIPAHPSDDSTSTNEGTEIP
jgi:ketosteroid isomerase-like protein